MRDMFNVHRRNLYEDGTDASLETLESWNQFSDQVKPQRRLLDSLLEDEKPFHQTILPVPRQDPHNPQPHQVAPPPAPPQPKPLRSVLVR
jgi:hypothetical protein